LASIIGGTTHTCDHVKNDWGCVEANTSQRKWWIVCDCNGKGCHKCNDTGRKYPERCPVHYYDNDIKTLRYLYANYRYKNILPFSGSPIEQPKVLIEAFNMIDYYLNIRDTIKKAGDEKADAVVNRIMKGKNG